MKQQTLTIDEKVRRIRHALELAEPSPGTDVALASAPSVQTVAEPIAIVGLSCQLPRSRSVHEFWAALDSGDSLIEEIPGSRFDLRGSDGPSGKVATKTLSRWGGFIPDVAGFDAEFFGLAASKAAWIDPRQRLLLMSIYHTLEDAGYAPGSLAGTRTGVYIAAEENEYAELARELKAAPDDVFANAPSMLPNCLSHHLDLRGPSELVNAMCASAAVALHRAVRDLRSGEVEQALVGAATLLLSPRGFVQLGRLGQLTAERVVRSFGAGACGHVRAEGVASVLLKPLRQAQRDGDAIYGVIRGSAVNYNGRGGTSITAPDYRVHADLIVRCYREAGVDPREIDYVEAQGMANDVADLAEWMAINRALLVLAKERGVRLAAGSCRVSTLKPMLGHMEAASAFGALFKILHSFARGQIYGIVGFERPNPAIDQDGQPCRLASETAAWANRGRARLAGLHSFGAGGSNAHLLVEEYCEQRPARARSAGDQLVVPLSARSRPQCLEQARRLLEAIEGSPGLALEDVSWTLQVGRDAMDQRVAFVASDIDMLRVQLAAYLQGRSLEGVFDGSRDAGHARATTTESERVAARFARGDSVSFVALHSGREARRLHLGTYPFNLRPCWFGERVTETLSEPNGARRIDGERGLDARAAKAEAIVRDVLCDVLRIPPPELLWDSDLGELSFESASVMKTCARLAQRHGIALEPAALFECRTPRALVLALLEYSPGEIAAHTPALSIEAADRVSGPAGSGVAPDRGRPSDVVSDVDGIAIIGLAGVYPGARDLHALWDNLIAGVNSVTEGPHGRWSVERYYDGDRDAAGEKGKTYGKWGGFLDNAFEFDPVFFKLSPRDVSQIHPEERLFLQCAWHSMEDAGYTPEVLSSECVGVFVGLTKAGLAQHAHTFFSVPNRVSFTFDFRGPSLAYDTACSSSLVAVHEACVHLLAGECSVAIAGGSNVYTHPFHFATLSKYRMLAVDGKVRAFGAEASGFAPGEGVGAVLLKPLAQAIRDQDPIHAVLRSSVTNHGGRTNGFTVPNPRAHRDLVQLALRRAKIDASRVSYVEAHGTGTSLGDPIEIRGLSEAFRAHTSQTGFCRIGSIKTNIGHLEAAAGIAGLTKVVLQMQHGKIAPSLHAERANPQIEFDKTAFVLARTPEDWQPVASEGKAASRIACVSSFGAGGSNAHVIVEEVGLSRPRRRTRVRSGPLLFVLSAKTSDALGAYARLIHDRAAHADEVALEDLAYTMQVGREAMRHRVALLATSGAELRSQLERFLAGEAAPDVLVGQSRAANGALDVFSDNKAEALIASWMDKHELRKLAEVWANGARVDWSRLYGAERPSRVRAPVYPFARDVYAMPAFEPDGGRAAATPAPPDRPEAGPAARPLAPARPPSATPDGAPAARLPAGTHLLASSWDAVPAPGIAAEAPGSERLLIVGAGGRRLSSWAEQTDAQALITGPGDDIETLRARLGNATPLNHVVWVAAASGGPIERESLIEDQEASLLACFRLIKALLELGHAAKPLSLTLLTEQARGVLPNEQIDPTHAGLFGLFGSLAKEHPRWRVRVADVEAGWQGSWAEISGLPFDRAGSMLAYRRGGWLRERLLPFQALTAESAYRARGVYVIIGGGGGIGEVWSEYMIRNYQAHIVWIGRRPFDAPLAAKQARLGALGEEPLYISADATEREALEQAYAEIKKRFGRIDGVVHATITLKDASLAKMDEAAFRASLSAKLDTSVRMAQVFGRENLDFVLFFSSLQSYVMAAGQSNYAAGCTFQDSFAAALNQAWPCPVKVMNWGYWGNVGIVASAEHRERMLRLGYASIEAAEGMQALETLLSSPIRQLALLATTGSADPLECVAADQWVSVAPRAGSLPQPDIAHPAGALERSSCERLRLEGGGALQELEANAASVLGAQLAELGVLLTSGRGFGAAEAAPPIASRYERWCAESLAILARSGVARPPSLESAWRTWDARQAHYQTSPHVRHHAKLVDVMLRALPQILTANRAPTDLMFPDGSLRLIEGIHRDSLQARFFNDSLAGVLAEHLRRCLRQAPERRFRILEVGAGTGATTSAVLAALQDISPSIAEYTYSDISELFLKHARDTFAPTAPYLRCALFDVEKPLATQGVEIGSYDVVIAANVLHATRSVRSTLRNAKAALRQGGLLLLNEMSQKALFAHLTFGLLDGWWRYEDPEARIPGSPVVAPETWRALLACEGFAPVSFPLEAAHDLGQQIVLGSSDGIIRQRAVAAAPARAPAATADASFALPVCEAPKRAQAGLGLGVIENILLGLLAESVNVLQANIDVTDPFADYGVDSITGIRFVQAINCALGVQLETTSLFDHSSVAAMTTHIATCYPDVLAGRAAPAAAAEPAAPAAAAAPATHPAAAVRAAPVASAESALAVASSIPPASAPPEPRPFASSSGAAAAASDAVAIIGISGRFASAANLAELWGHLRDGNDLVEDVTRWDLSELWTRAAERGLSYCKCGGFLDGIDRFDAGFFKISGLEAAYMDPQQRLFLEECWSALEDAAYAGSGMRGLRCGVYAGYTGGDYLDLIPEDSPAQAMWGNAGAVIPARIAYHLDLQGPAVAVDTACSSSLVALHLAAQALRSGEIEMALAGGVFVQSTPRFYVLANRAEMLSPTGRCRTFDKDADGFVPSEGVGVVVLKRLGDAQRDGDHVYAVLRGSGMNQDGRSNGITAPSGAAQERLVRQVYEDHGVHPEQIQMVEAHGTGTKLGDPIELQALTRAFRHNTDKTGYCAIGSIKTNIGHATAAAGVAGLLKVVLSLQHEQIPPSVHFHTENPDIHLTDSPFFVNRELRAWRAGPGEKRRAAVSSFGFSGTNAHAVIEEPPRVPRHHARRPGWLVAVSAQSVEQMQTQARQFLRYCQDNPAAELGNVSHTLLLGRRHCSHRWASVVQSVAELRQRLELWLAHGAVSSVYASAGSTALPYRHADVAAPDLIQGCALAASEADYLERLRRVAELYAEGRSFEFEPLFAGGGYCRLPMPLYPFARERHWVPADLPRPTPRALTSPRAASSSVPSDPPAAPAAPAASKEATEHRDGALVHAATERLIALIAEVTRSASERLGPDVPFEELGLDSLMISTLSQRISAWVGELDSTLFYRFQSARALAEHLARRCPAAFASAPAPAREGASGQPMQAQPAPASTSRRGARDRSATPIAVVGIGARYPEAQTLEQLRVIFEEGRDCVREIPSDRWPLAGFFEPDPVKAAERGLSYAKWGGFLDRVDCFDPQFFNISPREAITMDPHERLFLEVAWECIEDAGYTRRALLREKKRVGVFVGATFNNYQLLMAEQALRQQRSMYVANSQIYSIANRVSYVMNFTGPSFTVDTACSSSLYALHLACESIRSGQAQVALAGGVNLSLHPSKYVTLSHGRYSAIDGRCHSFCEGGTGYVPAEGVGALLLKPLEDAVRNGDQIYGVVLGTAATHAGKTNGYTIPSPASQSLAIEQALEHSGVDPRSITCIEAHGTGTVLGDPIEVDALTEVFRKYTNGTGYCALSSAKSNLGHAEAAAGIAGVTKALLQLKHRRLFKNVMHGAGLNPNIDFSKTPFVVQAETTEWRQPIIDGEPQPRRVGVSSFGAGGANAHVVLEEYLVPEEAHAAQAGLGSPVMVVLSARGSEPLDEQARRLLAALGNSPSSPAYLVSMAYTLQVGREPANERLALLASSAAELREKLEHYLARRGEGREWYRGRATNGNLGGTASDAAAQQAIDDWLQVGDHERLLQRWVSGLDIDWQRLYGASPPRRVSLPTYPFARQRLWIGDARESAELDREAKRVPPPLATVGSPGGRSPLPEGVSQPSQPIRGGASPSAAVAAPRPPIRPTVTLAVAAEDRAAVLPAAAKPRSVGLRALSDAASRFTGDAGRATLAELAAVAITAPAERGNDQRGAGAPGVGAPLATIRERLATSLAAALYLDVSELDESKKFVDLGLDSIVGVEWIRAINRELEAGLSVAHIYEHPTLSELAAFVHQGLRERPATTAPPARPETPAATNPASASADTRATEDQPSPALDEHGERPTREAAQSLSQPDLEASLGASLAAALYLDLGELAIDKKFIDLGLDSIVGVEWIRAINQAHGTSLEIVEIYNHPTIRELAAFLKQGLESSDRAPAPPARVPRSSEAVRAPGALQPAPSTTYADPVSRPVEVPAVSAPPSAATSPHEGAERIAIIGMSGCYPGAANLEQYWAILRDGVSSVSEVPSSRWDVAAHYDPRPNQPGKTNCKWGAFLSDIACFDPEFFEISASEAEHMDPQHRLFLQEGYKAFEDAGYTRTMLNGARCGVYLGIMSNEYGMMLYRSQTRMPDTTGTTYSIAAGRLPYHLNLTGMAIPVDTACSSSLVATHLACSALAAGELDMALVGGVSLYLTAASYVGMSAAGMLSPSGQCSPFDNGANGFVPGEGCGAILLKRQRDAERDGDPIYALIAGSGVNQNGRTNGITSPSMSSQAALQRRVYERSGIRPDSISYVEAHGTGTRLGDGMELMALANVFQEATARQRFCAVGSVKANIGHTSAASGVASIHKVLLSLAHRTLVPSLNFRVPNDFFDLERSPFFVNDEGRAWDSPAGVPRRAAINALGYSGTNAHLVIEEYSPPADQRRQQPAPPSPRAFVLSARTPEQLIANARSLATWIEAQPSIDWADLAYTLQLGREAMTHRLGFVANGRSSVLEALRGVAARKPSSALLVGSIDRDRADEAAWVLESGGGPPSTEDWTAALEEWVHGRDVEWMAFYAHERPRRIHLPTYSFSKGRYWASALSSSATNVEPAPHSVSAARAGEGSQATRGAAADGNGKANADDAFRVLAERISKGELAEHDVIGALMNGLGSHPHAT